METFDVIVIGAGHNGLAAAAALGARGKRVCVLERSAGVGGMADGRLAHLVYNLSEAERRRLGVHLSEVDTVSLARDGRHVAIRGGSAAYADGGAHPDAAAYAALHARLVRFAGVLAHLAEAPPPGFEGGLTSLEGLREIARLGKVGLGLKRLGKAEMREFLRVVLSNAFDTVLDEIGDGPLAGALTADAVRGAWAGPRSPGTVFSLMYRLGQGGRVFRAEGSMGAVAAAYAEKARAAGCDIRVGVPVARVVVEDDRAVGVELEGGVRIAAQAVLSSAGPLQTMLLAGVAHFDVEAARRARGMRAKGSAAKVNFALSGRPLFTGLSEAQHGARLVVAPSAAAVEQSFNPAKYGELPKAPVLEMVLEDGRLSVIATHVPYEGWTDARRAALGALVAETVEAYAPGFASLVTGTEVLTPADIAAMTGAPGGHWHHAEMGLDQVLTLRPIAGNARYRLAVGGLYLCGASAHPGGDVTGLPGRNAAGQVLADGVL
ncbi:MAG: NAD(P)/FAD-dependent oxidoreductase [Pseudooceanicola sp.]|nr:NAD(P)/FAD-dependent oxidoreductase [Pseudooceanicola sp.]